MTKQGDQEPWQVTDWQAVNMALTHVVKLTDGRRAFSLPYSGEANDLAAALNDLEARLTAAEAERTRLRQRTHEIQERADKVIAPLEKFHRVTKEQTFPFLHRHGWHPDDGGPNSRYWYGYLWEREKTRALAAEAKATRLETALRRIVKQPGRELASPYDIARAALNPSTPKEDAVNE